MNGKDHFNDSTIMFLSQIVFGQSQTDLLEVGYTWGNKWVFTFAIFLEVHENNCSSTMMSCFINSTENSISCEV